MKRLLFILLAVGFVGAANGDNCIYKCRIDLTDRCEDLSYYMKNCAKCGTVSKQCSTAFCKKHPNNCSSMGPLKELSINTTDNKSTGDTLDVCSAKLFPPMQFENRDNSNFNIMNLNLLNYSFYSQKDGPSLAHELGNVRNLIANYLIYKETGTVKKTPNLSAHVDQWLSTIFHKNFENLTPFDIHMISEFVRRDLYILKGIKTQTKKEIFKGETFPMTVSKLGCKGEPGIDPIASKSTQLYSNSTDTTQ